MSKAIRRIKQFYGETLQEVKRCSWPNRPELIEQTLLVLAGTLIFTVFVFFADKIITQLVWGIMKIGKYL